MSDGTLQVNVYAAEGAVPGSLLESFNTSTRFDHSIAHFTSVVNPLLSAGNTYFVEATTLGEADGVWHLSPLASGTTTDARRFDNSSAWETGTRDFNAAFSVSGTPTSAQTPEPGTILLLGTGMVALYRRRLRVTEKRGGIPLATQAAVSAAPSYGRNRQP